ncbi:MAG: hypothetical protein LBG66_04520, partial [Gallionellaceae bacterium]|nr:hypothetical protein [Gallionellaceae bacterium]
MFKWFKAPNAGSFANVAWVLCLGFALSLPLAASAQSVLGAAMGGGMLTGSALPTGDNGLGASMTDPCVAAP